MSDDDMRKWETEAARARYERNKQELAKEKAASERLRRENSGGASGGCAIIPGIILLGTAAAALHQHLAPLFS